MWGSCTDTSAWRGVNDYQRAFERWQNAPQWRGDPKTDFTPRKVDRNSSKRQWSIRLLQSNGGIACRYWNTDVVVFDPDGAITLHPWRSASTDAFANALTPSGVETHFNNSFGVLVSAVDADAPGNRWERPRRIYHLDGYRDGVTFERREDGQWWPREPERYTQTFDVPRVDRSRARAVLLKRDFKRFKLWVMTAAMMNAGQPHEWGETTQGYHRRYRGENPLVLIYEDQERWTELLHDKAYWPESDARVVCCGRPVTTRYVGNRYAGTSAWETIEPLTRVERTMRQVNRIVNAMRLALYETDGCVTVEKLPYVESWNQLAAVKAAQRVYSWV